MIQVEENFQASAHTALDAAVRTARGTTGGAPNPLAGKIEGMESVLRGFTQRTVSSLREATGANVDKITLEFGLGLGGETSIPFVTKGKADASLRIKVECSFRQSP